MTVSAKICLPHSFNNKKISDYVGKQDVTADEMNLIINTLSEIQYDEYDKLIQLCDALAGSEGVLDIVERMQDVKNRYGFYPQDKWDKNVDLLKYFENLTQKNIYLVVEKK